MFCFSIMHSNTLSYALLAFFFFLFLLHFDVYYMIYYLTDVQHKESIC